MFFNGSLKAMPPKLLSDDRQNVVIRPLAYCKEKDLARFAQYKAFPITKSGKVQPAIFRCRGNRRKAETVASIGRFLECEQCVGTLPVVDCLQKRWGVHFVEETVWFTIQGHCQD